MACLCCMLHAARQAIVLHREAEFAETFAGGVVDFGEINKVMISDPVHIALQGVQRASSAAAGAASAPAALGLMPECEPAQADAFSGATKPEGASALEEEGAGVAGASLLTSDV